MNAAIRVGIGYDVHRWADGRPLILGGVDIPHEQGLIGHSDADVLTHAIVDALLGAAALGDIGRHFPDTDAVLKDADSIHLLQQVLKLLGNSGYRVGNVDSTIVAERPKLAPHIDSIRRRLAEAMGVALDVVSVKATTSEGLLYTGTPGGMAAYAICTLAGCDSG